MKVEITPIIRKRFCIELNAQEIALLLVLTGASTSVESDSIGEVATNMYQELFNATGGVTYGNVRGMPDIAYTDDVCDGFEPVVNAIDEFLRS